MVAITQTLVILSLFLAFCTCDVEKRSRAFKTEDCSTNGTQDIFRIPDLHIYPEHVELPGNITVWGTFNLTQEIAQNITLNLDVQRRVGFLWFSAINNDYDLCEYAHTSLHCPAQLLDSNIQCTCPFEPGVYKLKHELFTIPKVKGIVKTLAQGDYRIVIKLTDAATDEALSCTQISVSLVKSKDPTLTATKKPCHGFFNCLIG